MFPVNCNGLRVRALSMAVKSVTALTLFFSFATAVPAQAQTPKVLHTFMQTTTDACAPRGNIVQGRDGNMYGGGAACGAGGSGGGAIYKISPAGVESVFFNFPPQWTNCGGAGLTLGSDGNFYGACEGGNPATGMGSIFRLTPAKVFTDLHDFTGVNGDSLPVYPPIQASDGNFYGVTGNEVQVCGNIYKMTPAGVYTNLHTFSGSDCHSSNLMQASDGNLYGTLANCTLVQGAGCAYKISTAGVFKEIHDFAFTTGQTPCTGLIQGKDGKLYGATQQGAANGNGNIYKMTTAGVAIDVHDFTNATDASCVNNSGPPVNLLQVADGSFYGVNPAFGPNGTGSVYKLTSAGVFTVFLFPNPPIDGDLPSSTLIQNTNGLVYGTTPSGGGGGGGCPSTCQGVFFSVATGDAAFVNLEPTQKTGFVGASVGLFGQGFSSASVVKFGGVAATTKTLSGTTYMTAVVPAGAHTGPVTVTTGATTLTSPQTYKVKPKITGFTPPNGPPATLVTITGTGFIQATAVKFGTVKATTFKVVSDSKVTAAVPSGLAAGAVTVSITSPGGSGSSPKKFMVQ
jgi:uncharacterized repeat protein (TIGR03803 family)